MDKLNRLLIMLLSIVTCVIHSLVIVGFNLIMPILLAFGIKDVEITLSAPTILLTFIMMYAINKFIWNTLIKESYHTFMTTFVGKKKCI